MDLQGKIEKFNVPDIFQLISSGKRTGTLGIIRNNQTAMLYFQDGRITYAYSPSTRNKIGERLIERGFIDNDSLNDALTRQKSGNGKNRIGRILTKENKINEQQLASVLTEQISDIVYKVMSWDKGLFKFYDDKFPTEEENSLSLSTESLILEGAKRVDELNKLKSKLPDFNSHLKLKKSTDKKDVEIRLPSEQWNILAMCDSNHSIDDIISQADNDPEPVMKTIIKLLELDLIKPCGQSNVGADNLTQLELQIEILADLLNKFLEKD